MCDPPYYDNLQIIFFTLAQAVRNSRDRSTE